MIYSKTSAWTLVGILLGFAAVSEADYACVYSSSGYDSFSDTESTTSLDSRDRRHEIKEPRHEEEVMNFRSTDNLCANLRLILQMPDMCDVTFLVGQRETPVHGVKAILGTRSCVFYQLLLKHQALAARSGDAKQSKKKSARAPSLFRKLVIPVHKYDAEVFRMLVEFVHCGAVNISEDTVAGLYCGASQFQLKDLQAACLDFVERCLVRGRTDSLLTAAREYSQHKASQTLFDKPRSQSSVLGQLSRSDCKQFVPQGDLDRDWLSIAFRHVIGYVARTGNVQINACTGNPPKDDVVSRMPSTSLPASTASSVAASSTAEPSTTAPSTTRSTKPSTASLSVSSPTPSSTSASTSASTAATSTASPKSSTTSANPDGNVHLCPNPLVDGDHISGEHGGYCYELITTEKVSWDHAERLCQNKRGYHAHLTSITSSGEQAFLQAFLIRHKPNNAVWIGLHDTSIGRHFTWSSGDQVTYTNWLPGRSGTHSGYYANCVVMVPYKNGTWVDLPCGNTGMFSGDSGEIHYTLCEYKAPSANQLQATTLAPSYQVQSGSYMCRTHSHSSSNVVMTQRGDDCYELLLDRKLSWVHGESTCARGGGHLVYIGSAEEQSFLQGFLQTNSADHAVWIGLTDRNSENSFRWTNGKSVSYTNWTPNHTSNFLDHTQEDCVVIIPYQEGQWDDIPCGNYDQYGLLVDTGETHYVLCQYSRLSLTMAVFMTLLVGPTAKELHKIN